MEELADASLDFAPFWNKLKSAQCVVVSLMIAGSEERPSQKVLDTACGEDGQFQRCLTKCEEQCKRHLKLFDLYNEEGSDSD